MKKRFFILLLLYCLPALLKAQSSQPQYQLTRVDISQGLSANQVNCILKDSRGFMWFGTMSGLNRYDGYNFRIFRQDLRDSSTLSDNFITKLMEGPDGLIWITHHNGQNIYNPEKGNFYRHPGPVLQQYGVPADSIGNILKDKQGRFWFIVPRQGAYAYLPSNKKQFRICHTTDKESPADNNISTMAEDPAGNHWLLHGNGLLEKMDGHSLKITYRYQLPGATADTSLQNYEMLADRDGDLWIFNTSNVQGVYCYKPSTSSLVHYDQNSTPLRLNNNIVRGVVQDNQGRIWIGTDHGGINIIDKKQSSINYLLNNSEDPKSLSQNSINALYCDNTGIIWIGTYKKGFCYYHENIVKFPLYQHLPFAKNSLPYDDVNRFAEDANGNLWIGTNGGGLIYFDRTKNTYKQYLHDPHNPNSPSGNVVVSLWIDHAQKLWIGTYYGGLDCFDGRQFTHYRHDPAYSQSLSDNSVWEIFEDSRQRLWVGTLSGGLNQLDRSTGKFQRYVPGAPNSVVSKYISAILEDKQGNVWVGTSDGVDIISNQGKFTHYGESGISNRNVVCMFEDSRGLIWVGTREGLNLYDPRTRKFRIFRREDGLADNTVLNILEDNSHTLWFSTTNGLSNLTIRNGKYLFRNYDESDGLQGREFNENAALKTRKGELIFGGGNGFNLFYPHTIAGNNTVPPIVLTDFQIFNQSILPGQNVNGRVLLEQSITQTRHITLKYRENVFSIDFSALNYFHPEKNQYAYMLEGFNNEWLTTDGSQRKATYTNLDPGQYTFRLKASNNDGIWTPEPLELHITILPPFWRTPLAFFIYVLLIIGALILARKITLERERLRSRIEQERQEAQRMHELDALKIRFFTNISHEFRTPLSLIITPLEKILRKGTENNIQQQLVLVQRNARRLLNLVNQLLDFRKMEVQEIRLYTAEGDLVSYIRELTFSFSDLSEKKQIHLDFHSNISELTMLYDPDKIEKIIFNLLSNAFKFTPEQGNISVDLQLLEGGQLAIMVKDTGIGIPAEQQEKIFERFFQHDIPGSLVNQGSGIGLSITREFVKLHGGSISVDSSPGMGSCFTIILPVKGVITKPQITDTIKTSVMAALPAPESPAAYNGKKPVLLLIEDSEDFRFYLKDNLSAHFHIVDAPNGRIGWDILQQTMPNLVVSDVNMPEMDGLELCRRIRQQPKTAHLPVILLTARASEEDQLEALDNGATDYITKPFNYEVLLSRIRNIISQQDSLKKTFRQHIEAHPEEIAISSQDEQFIQSALQIVEKNISNPDFSVEELSRELHMSRVSAYKKLLSLTGKTPIEFIRSIRLKRAAQLLGKSQLTVAEVAYEVGFNNPKYFAKYFKLEYGVLPSAYKNT
ncbi:hybrid sensor histidine kinase/response regulator transcription factor [Chitinophaga tropicalis]|uniref:histidine kinase n=1 Tax=Chitinophaga tropicalis TaxID=2683588 RepID=A0A7K1U2H6_9BACT|nr:two-component regulator propeller domain-containing protein [Chitinophaga tropicalis]MVT08572.1 response regulator [Chitinophaga tropicalis]